MATQTHFDAIIVGSGFGGSVMAYRLAKAGQNVCLLERGKAYPPGSFPRTPSTMSRNFWDPSEGLYGMFDVWSFEGLEGLVSSGLGGGSLIYANVLLRKDEKWFVNDDPDGDGKPWPVTRAMLDPHYAEAERMLGATPFPFAEKGYSDTPKTRAMFEAAQKIGRGLDIQLPPLAVTFGNPDRAPVPGEPIEGGEINLHGRHRLTCLMCGECDAGCNYGSKNTLDYNYLSRAKELGADIRTLAEVRSFAPRRDAGSGYSVHYVQHDAEETARGRNTRALPLNALTCDRLVLSAGTFGTPYLLLKNGAGLPALSKKLGSRFCGNGDLLTFAVNCTESGADGDTKSRTMDPSRGPVITCALRLADTADGGEEQGRGFYVEDAGIPSFMTWMFEMTDMGGGAKRVGEFMMERIKHALHLTGGSHLSGAMSHLLGAGARSNCSLPLLGMGRDMPNGTMSLDDDGRLANDWSMDKSKPYFDRVRGVMEELSNAWGAEHFQDNLLWYFNRVITVHPLGGCPMGDSIETGVVNSWGEVFGAPGLYVADGSVMPGPVGANPSLTIAALADRFATGIIEGKT
ncbi:MAG: GMC family oxidoreductase [bacterium]